MPGPLAFTGESITSSAPHDAEPGESYAISFKDSGRGPFIQDWLKMRPGESYECPPFTGYCNVDQVADTSAIATGGGDVCDPSYPDVCLDPAAIDYDCEGGTGDGPEYVDGPITVRATIRLSLMVIRRMGSGANESRGSYWSRERRAARTPRPLLERE
jgi:hypothetical protein